MSSTSGRIVGVCAGIIGLSIAFGEDRVSAALQVDASERRITVLGPT